MRAVFRWQEGERASYRPTSRKEILTRKPYEERIQRDIKKISGWVGDKYLSPAL
jgi:hypothetical protein